MTSASVDKYHTLEKGKNNKKKGRELSLTLPWYTNRIVHYGVTSSDFSSSAWGASASGAS